jgi:hypothetical protein
LGLKLKIVSGAILDDFGFKNMLDEVMKKYISPFANLLFPEWIGTGGLDSHHGFVVKYKIGEDEDLDFHMDESEITLNVCLGKSFQGGNLFFNGVRGDVSEKKEEFQFAHTPGIYFDLISF